MADLEIIDCLRNIGLSSNESTVYLELLKLGPSNAGPIVRKCKIHRQLVYSALEKLESKKLITISVKNNRKLFNAARPENLLDLENEKLRKLQVNIAKMKKLIPKSNSSIHVDVLNGKEEFLRRLFLLVDSAARTDNIIRMIADVRDVDVYAALGEYYDDYNKYLKLKKVRKKLIAPRSSISSAYRERLKKESGSEIRISDDSISSPSGICFTKEVVAFDIFSEDVLSLLVWNTTIAKSFDNHFNTLWKAAKPL